MIFLYHKSSYFGGKNAKYVISASEDHTRIVKTPYDDLDFNKLENIINRLINNYRILITVYGVLFAFIITTNLDKAFSNWAFIIWIGWTLAIIVKIGTMALDLSDMLEISNGKKLIDTARKIYSYKNYVKHALYLLVPAVAFLPILLYEIKPSQEIMHFWSQETSVISIAWGIFSVFLLIFWVVLRVSNFIYSRGFESFYLFAIILLVLGALQTQINSPLDPKEIVFFGVEETITNVFYVTVYVGSFAFWVGISIWIRFFYPMVSDKIKEKRNDSKREKESL